MSQWKQSRGFLAGYSTIWCLHSVVVPWRVLATPAHCLPPSLVAKLDLDGQDVERAKHLVQGLSTAR